MGLTVGPTTDSMRERVLAYAALVRLPNVFTAPPDVLAGAALVAVMGATAGPVEVGGLALASAFVYAGGTTLNDYFDANIDAVERPERPIPAGLVSRRRAVVLGVTLLGCGVAVALVAGGPQSSVAAGTLAALVVVYDGVAKGTPLGWGVMGLTRGANVILGTTVGSGVLSDGWWVVTVPLGVTGYVAAVTWMADDEAHGTDRTAVAAVAGLAAVLAVVPPAITVVAGRDVVLTTIAAGLGVGFLAFVGPLLLAAYRRPTASRVGPAVGRSVLGLAVVQAAVATVAGLAWTAAALGCFVVARLLAGAFDVS
ncbi:UbiA family prenyltransferase [Halomicroarcula sp. S1AR25-4]|uniref:UbiA family prenyltransferase n=1 Tax=Haloarcula sp. S1AR25-4 TaxID=2950538 RepID=UPI00287524E0|nr:UbiA family prenyltransferase [Halomicroarcula sp. S1AR25-4]MDS0276851.1 UbiA family prenyltransferase [Halomicroarcula sp. S1AR25-4]